KNQNLHYQQSASTQSTTKAMRQTLKRAHRKWKKEALYLKLQKKRLTLRPIEFYIKVGAANNAISLRITASIFMDAPPRGSEEFARHTPKGAKLPEHVKDRKRTKKS